MKIYKCDRCGKYMGEELVAGVMLNLDDEYTHIYDLCENCYQTIKEVLEDGEIK